MYKEEQRVANISIYCDGLGVRRCIEKTGYQKMGF